MIKKIIVISSLLISGVANAVEPPAIYQTCATCHGVNGIAVIDGYPNLAGQNKQYIINSLKAFKSGERTGGNAIIMAPMSQLLTTDQQIEEVAEYLNSL